MPPEIAHSEEPAPPSVDRRIAHYVIQGRIGEGGMGVVYRVLDSKLKRSVALKVLHPKVAEDEGRRKRFVREGRLVAHLTHPNIATVYDVGEADGRVYIAMELVEGEPLTSMIKPGRHVTVVEALRIMHEVARGLSRAHEIGVIHRDLKPDNIMVGDDGIVKILDFGVAKRLDTFKIDFTDIKTQHGSLVGTPAYMSPEQAAGKKEVDERSDVFSLGVVLFELLTGKRPFEGETWQETIIAINRDEPPLISTMRSDVPPGLDELVDGCLAKNPDARYRSCREVIEDIESILMTASTGTFPPGTATGILARSSIAPSSAPPETSTPPPVSGEITLEVPRSDERSEAPVTQAMAQADEVEPSPRSRGWLWGGMALAVLVGGAVVWGAADGGETASEVDGPEPAADVEDGQSQEDQPRGEEEGPDEPTTSAGPSPTTSAVPSVSAMASAAPPEDQEAPRGTSQPTAAAPPPGPTAVRPPTPKPLSPAPAPRPTTKPENPVLGF